MVRKGTQIVQSIMITPEQRAAIRKALSRDLTREKKGRSISALAREGFKDYCASMGVEWPEDENDWGGPGRTPQSVGGID